MNLTDDTNKDNDIIRLVVHESHKPSNKKPLELNKINLTLDNLITICKNKLNKLYNDSGDEIIDINQLSYGDDIFLSDGCSEDVFRKHIKIDGNSLLLDILDTAGQECFISYRIVYSIIDRKSYFDLQSFYDQYIKNIKNIIEKYFMKRHKHYQENGMHFNILKHLQKLVITLKI